MFATALRINVDGSIEEIEVNNIIDTLQTQTAYPYEEYKLLERYDLDNNSYLYLYGMTNIEYPFNDFEFQYFNITGDAFVLLVNEEGDFLDLTEDEFMMLYQEDIVLDTDLLNDELESGLENEYDFDTDWIEDDTLLDSDIEMY